MLRDRHLGREPVSSFSTSSPAVPCVRKQLVTPSLTSDAEISATVQLGAGAAPMRWISGTDIPPKRLFVTTGTDLLTISLLNRESTKYDAVGWYTHAADLQEGFVAAGPLVIAIYGEDRTPIWVFRVPMTDPLPSRTGELRFYSASTPQTAELSSFRLIGSWLVARWGERHLIGLDLRSKRVAWVLGTSGAAGFRPTEFPDAARFGSEFAITGHIVIVQLSGGRRWFVHLQTGKRLVFPGIGEKTAQAWWLHSPVGGRKIDCSWPMDRD